MKKIKQIDLFIQVALIILWVLSTIFSKTYFFYGYLIVGAWYLFSLICYIIFGSHSQTRHHTVIRIIIITIITVLSFGLIIESWLILALYFLLFGSPLLVIYYTYVCYMELKSLNERPLAQLK